MSLSRSGFGRLYGIVDVAPSGLSPHGLDLFDALVAAGVPWIQLRWKQAPAGAHVDLARILVERAGETRVVVNDRADVARLAGAAGVHLGQGDLPPAAARAVAADLVVGVSTHEVAEARAAAAAGADYIGFGPLFPTGSKADALAPRGLDALRAVRAATDLPIVAIGGITEATAAAVLSAGADAVAMIGALAASDDAGALARRIRRL